MSISVCVCFIWSAFVSICRHMSVCLPVCMSVYVGIVGICRHGQYMSVCMLVYVGICRHMSALSDCRHMSAWSAYIGFGRRICRHMSASVGICQIFGQYMSVCRCRVWGEPYNEPGPTLDTCTLIYIYLKWLGLAWDSVGLVDTQGFNFRSKWGTMVTSTVTG